MNSRELQVDKSVTELEIELQKLKTDEDEVVIEDTKTQHKATGFPEMFGLPD